MIKIKSMDFNLIKENIRAFDIIAFRGSGIVDDIISMFEKYEISCGDFSHVGMVITSDVLTSFKIASSETENTKFVLEPGKLYILESTLSGHPPDVSDSKISSGVCLRELETVIPKYIINEKTKVAWCKLINNPLDNQFFEPEKKKFKKMFLKYHEKSYDMSPIDLAAAMFPVLRPIRNVKNELFNNVAKMLGMASVDTPSGWQFCSEIIANFYKEFDVIAKDFNPEDVLPMDFFGFDEDGLPNLIKEIVYIKDWDEDKELLSN